MRSIFTFCTLSALFSSLFIPLLRPELLDYLMSWEPFHISALAIITLLGAEEVDRAVGRFANAGITAALPLLGAFRLAGNNFVQPIPGFVLYNVSDGITTTDLTGWFCRWL